MGMVVEAKSTLIAPFAFRHILPPSTAGVGSFLGYRQWIKDLFTLCQMSRSQTF